MSYRGCPGIYAVGDIRVGVFDGASMYVNARPGGPDGGYVTARPSPWQGGLLRRLRIAWDVFRGRYDALDWGDWEES